MGPCIRRNGSRAPEAKRRLTITFESMTPIDLDQTFHGFRKILGAISHPTSGFIEKRRQHDLI